MAQAGQPCEKKGNLNLKVSEQKLLKINLEKLSDSELPQKLLKTK
jgi:hypothetical protein